MRSGPRVGRARIWDDSTHWLATTYDDVRSVLSDARLSADPDNLGYPHYSAGSAARKQNHTKMFISLDDPKHRELRRMVTQDFTVKNVEKLRPRIQQIVDELVDQMLDGEKPTDFVEAFSLALPSLVICEMLGVPFEDRASFHEMSCAMTSRTVTPERAVEALGQMREFMAKLVDQKAANPADDIVSRLVANQLNTGAVSLEDLLATLELLLVGGHETTNNMIALGIAVLLEHPEALAEIRESDDHQLVANAVEELLRYLSIFHMGRGRAALHDTDLNGHPIQSGEGVIAALDVANRDPDVFSDPDRFDIHRQNARRHVAFGFGVHQCLGQTLARVELQVALRILARRIPTLALAVPFEDLPFKHDSAVFGVHELPVIW